MATEASRQSSPLFKKSGYLHKLQKLVGIDELDPVIIESDDYEDEDNVFNNDVVIPNSYLNSMYMLREYSHIPIGNNNKSFITSDFEIPPLPPAPPKFIIQEKPMYVNIYFFPNMVKQISRK